MSKKGHGPSEGGDFDHHVTPAWAVDRLLEVWKPKGGIWVEPGAGSGAIIRAVSSHRNDITWHAIEIQRRFQKKLYSAGAAIVTIGNFITEMPPRLSDIAVVLGNPPFTWALQFIVQSRTLCPNAEICLLMSLNILASSKRRAFMSANTPDEMVLPDRPSFKQSGDTDAQDYAWFRWLPDNRQRGRITILGATPGLERGRGR